MERTFPSPNMPHYKEYEGTKDKFGFTDLRGCDRFWHSVYESPTKAKNSTGRQAV